MITSRTTRKGVPGWKKKTVRAGRTGQRGLGSEKEREKDRKRMLKDGGREGFYTPKTSTAQQNRNAQTHTHYHTYIHMRRKKKGKRRENAKHKHENQNLGSPSSLSLSPSPSFTVYPFQSSVRGRLLPNVRYRQHRQTRMCPRQRRDIRHTHMLMLLLLLLLLILPPP